MGTCAARLRFWVYDRMGHQMKGFLEGRNDLFRRKHMFSSDDCKSKGGKERKES